MYVGLCMYVCRYNVSYRNCLLMKLYMYAGLGAHIGLMVRFYSMNSVEISTVEVGYYHSA